jgi:hypothetical protein
MPTDTPTKPIEDSVGKVDDELALGADLPFQYKWWRFEFAVWIFFTILVVLDALGVFGRGYLAKADANATDGSMAIKYERVERYGTPSVLQVRIAPTAIRDGKVQLQVSKSLVGDLGNQRVVPQPEASTLNSDGILYTFPAGVGPVSCEFALQPSNRGMSDLTFQVPGSAPVNLKIFVMP